MVKLTGNKYTYEFARGVLHGCCRSTSEEDLHLLAQRMVENQSGAWHEIYALQVERGQAEEGKCPCGVCRKARGEPKPTWNAFAKENLDGRIGRPTPKG